MQRQPRSGPRMLRRRSSLLPAVENLDGALGRREHQLRAGPELVGHGLADGQLALDLALVDGVDGGVALGGGHGGVGALLLHREGRDLREGERGGGRGLKGGDLVARDPAVGDGPLLAALGESKSRQ